MKKILVTGANGFIGSHLIRQLIRDRHEVAIIRRRDSNVTRINDLLNQVGVFEGDLRNISSIRRIVSEAKPEGILHLATCYRLNPSAEEIHEMVQNNVLGTMNLLETAVSSSVQLFVNTSSCFVYQQGEGLIHEETPLLPWNHFALTKVQAERACDFYAERFSLPCVTLRLFPPYGPADHERRLIPYSIRQLLKGEPVQWTNGDQEWDFVHVFDVVRAYTALLQNFKTIWKHEIFNIGTGRVVSIRTIGETLSKILKSRSKLEWGVLPQRKNEWMHLGADIQKAKADLNWEPQIDLLERGLHDTASWFKEYWREK